MRTIAIVNQKGGCGKTTTAINLAGILAHRDHPTLLVDLDPQSHCAAGLAIPEDRIDLDIGQAMLGVSSAPLDRDRLLWRISRNLDLAPSTVRTAALEASRGGLADREDRDRRLDAVLTEISADYTVCCIDCPPSIGLLTFNALTAADMVLIPVETSYFSLQGASRQLATIRSLSKRVGSDIPTFLLPTIHDENIPLARDLLDELRRRFEALVVPAVIRTDPTLREASSFGRPVVEYAPDSGAAQDYSTLADWLVQTMGLDLHRGPAPRAIVDPATPAQTTASVSVASVTDGGESWGPRADRPTQPAAEPKPPARADELAERAKDLEQRLAALASRADQRAPVEPTPLVRPGAGRESAARLLGVRSTTQGTLFVQPATLGRRLAIAADFNAWSESTHVFRFNEELGVHELCVPLPGGTYRYRLVADGRWVSDPFNPEVERNPYGELNNVLRVPTNDAMLRSLEAKPDGTRPEPSPETKGATDEPARHSA